MTITEQVAFNRTHIAAVRVFLIQSRKTVRGNWKPQMRVRLVWSGGEMSWDTREDVRVGQLVQVSGRQWTVAAVVRTVPGLICITARGVDSSGEQTPRTGLLPALRAAPVQP